MQKVVKIIDEMIDKIEDFKYHEDVMDNEYYRGRHEGELATLDEVKQKLQSMSDNDGYIPLDEAILFADWYHNGLSNYERSENDIEKLYEAFKKLSFTK